MGVGDGAKWFISIFNASVCPRNYEPSIYKRIPREAVRPATTLLDGHGTAPYDCLPRGRVNTTIYNNRVPVKLARGVWWEGGGGGGYHSRGLRAQSDQRGTYDWRSPLLAKNPGRPHSWYLSLRHLELRGPPGVFFLTVVCLFLKAATFARPTFLWRASIFSLSSQFVNRLCNL